MQLSHNSNQTLNWGQQALLAEGKGILKVAANLDAQFSQAVETLMACKGKVVLTGIGKSGHIAAKISSTLASTGTPSFYLHPSEALHGDFGMLGPKDCLIAVAYRGETREVVCVADFAKALKVPVIAITGFQTSTLAKTADFTITGAIDQEADPLDLAPTVSSTVALAIGDALAVSLMHTKEFSKQNFARLHPGGSLGRSLSRVSEFMQPAPKLPHITPDSDFLTLIEKINTPNYGIIAVVDSLFHLVGSITDGDIRRVLLKQQQESFNIKACDLMNFTPKTIPSNSYALDAIKIMEQHKVTSLFVVESTDSARLVGLLRLHDLIASNLI